MEGKGKGPMPAKDYYHDTVKRAPQKDGWIIVDEQVKLNVGLRRLWIDFEIAKSAAQGSVLVEVKGLEAQHSLVDQLSDAIGQYIVYTAVLAAMC